MEETNTKVSAFVTLNTLFDEVLTERQRKELTPLEKIEYALELAKRGDDTYWLSSFEQHEEYKRRLAIKSLNLSTAHISALNSFIAASEGKVMYVPKIEIATTMYDLYDELIPRTLSDYECELVQENEHLEEITYITFRSCVYGLEWMAFYVGIKQLDKLIPDWENTFNANDVTRRAAQKGRDELAEREVRRAAEKIEKERTERLQAEQAARDEEVAQAEAQAVFGDENTVAVSGNTEWPYKSD